MQLDWVRGRTLAFYPWPEFDAYIGIVASALHRLCSLQLVKVRQGLLTGFGSVHFIGTAIGHECLSRQVNRVV